MRKFRFTGTLRKIYSQCPYPQTSCWFIPHHLPPNLLKDMFEKFFSSFGFCGSLTLRSSNVLRLESQSVLELLKLEEKEIGWNALLDSKITKPMGPLFCRGAPLKLQNDDLCQKALFDAKTMKSMG